MKPKHKRQLASLATVVALPKKLPCADAASYDHYDQAKEAMIGIGYAKNLKPSEVLQFNTIAPPCRYCGMLHIEYKPINPSPYLVAYFIGIDVDPITTAKAIKYTEMISRRPP